MNSSRLNDLSRAKIYNNEYSLSNQSSLNSSAGNIMLRKPKLVKDKNFSL